MRPELQGMTHAKWILLTPAQRTALRDLGGLTQQLIGLEGWRVEVQDVEGGKPRRFIVGRSTGWRPCHIEIKTARSLGGFSARDRYASVRTIRKVR